MENLKSEGDPGGAVLGREWWSGQHSRGFSKGKVGGGIRNTKILLGDAKVSTHCTEHR